jgi:hypothetical protein
LQIVTTGRASLSRYSWRQRLLGDGRGGQGRHLRILSKLVLAGDDDTVALGKPQCNIGAVISRRSGFDRTCLDHIAFDDYPGEYPVGPDLDGRRRNRESVPSGFHRIRHYGLLASGTRAVNIARARELLAVPVSPEPPDTTETPAADQARMLPRPCPCCGGRMFIIETFARGCEPKHRPTPVPAAIGIDTS